MAPLTRNRAGAGQVPSPLAPACYAQRASAGLIISEAAQVSAAGQGYRDTPGHLFGGAGGRLAPRHRRRTRGARQDRAAALACRPQLACVAAARRRLAGLERGVRMRIRSPRTATCRSNSCATASTIAPTLMADRSRTACAFRSKSYARLPRKSAPSAPACACPRAPTSMTRSRTATRKRCSTISSPSSSSGCASMRRSSGSLAVFARFEPPALDREPEFAVDLQIVARFRRQRREHRL